MNRTQSPDVDLTDRELEPQATVMNAAKFQNLMVWLVDGARSAPDSKAMMAECCERLVEAGVPLWRVGVFIRTLHPEIIGHNFIWRQGAEVAVGTADFSMMDS